MYGLKEKGETLQLLAAKEPNPDLLKASLAAFDLATAVLDSMRSIYQEGSKQFWNQEARPVLEKAIGIALQLRQNTGDEQYLARAFDYAEKGKAYLLAESLLESAAQQQAGIPDSTLEREKQIKIDIAFYRKKVFELQHAGTPDTAKMLRWQSEIQRRHSAYEALMDTLKSRYPAYYQARYRQQITGMAQIRKELPDDTGLLEYFCGEHATYAFYIDRDHANAARCGADSSLGRVLAGLRKEDSQSDEHILSADAVHAFATDANSLYRSLMAPVMDHTPKQLILIADGQLAYLPFEILVTQPVSDISQPAYATLPYLLRATTIRYEYSALLTFQKPSERHATRFWDGYAPGYSREMVAQPLRGRKSDCQGWSASDFAPLPNNGKEIGQIAGLTGGRAIAGPEASEAFFRLHAREPRILHLAMHGFLNDCDPAYSGLVFSPSTADQSVKDTLLKEEQDGILHAYEIYNLHLNAELAVLSACNTGRGQLAQGEGVMSLARAFKYAGCPNVLMSLWQAHDAATAEIMQGFYRYLKQGYGKAAAIRAAKLDYLIAAPRSRQHPFFWGAFVLIGDDLPVKETTTTMWYIAGLLLLALVVFILHRVIKSGRNDRKWKLRLVNSN
jgi:CHAT domain-containing protein